MSDKISPGLLSGVKENNALPFLLLFILIIIAIVIATLAFGTPSRWIGHAITASVGVILLVMIVLTGMMMAGRIRFLHVRNVLFIHKILGVCFSAFVIGTFILGLVLMVLREETILQTPHGILGLTVAILCAVQLFPSLVIRERTSIRQIHRIVGYLIAVLFLLQVFLGLYYARLLRFIFG